MGQLKDRSDDLAEAFEPFLTVQQVIVLPIATLSAIIDFQAAKTQDFGPLERYMEVDVGVTVWE
ncbi:hypothetical protein PQX77_007434 [Marasmius sp. AFHP31]|nr:hypothetical protein PQX77_007434 [Marasmius sp. AFHP31]